VGLARARKKMYSHIMRDVYTAQQNIMMHTTIELYNLSPDDKHFVQGDCHIQHNEV